MHRRGFTLIELLIVICVLGILATIAIPNAREARERAQAVAILERIHGIRLATASLSRDELMAIPTMSAEVVPTALAAALGPSHFSGEGGIALKISQLARNSGTLLIAIGSTPAQKRILAHVAATTGDSHHYFGSMIYFSLSEGSRYF